MMTSMVAMVTRPKAAATRTTPAMLVRAVGMGMLPLQGVEVGMGMGFSPPGPAHPPDEISEPEPDKEPGRDLAPGRLHALELGHGDAQADAQHPDLPRDHRVPAPPASKGAGAGGNKMVDGRRFELPTSALRTPRSPS